MSGNFRSTKAVSPDCEWLVGGMCLSVVQNGHSSRVTRVMNATGGECFSSLMLVQRIGCKRGLFATKLQSLRPRSRTFFPTMLPTVTPWTLNATWMRQGSAEMATETATGGGLVGRFSPHGLLPFQATRFRATHSGHVLMSLSNFTTSSLSSSGEQDLPAVGSLY